MYGTFAKVAGRGIKGSLSRFLSIFGIVAIGTGFLAGLLATAPDMEESAAEFYNAHNTYDIQIQSDLGLTEQDAAAMKKLDDISDVQLIHTEDAEMNGAGSEVYVTRIFGVDLQAEKKGACINNVELVSGRYPEKDNECLLEVPNSYGNHHKVGESFSISSQNKNAGEIKKHYKYSRYKVTGIVKSPLFVSMNGETSTVGDGKVALALYISDDVCTQKEYSAMYATVKGASKLDPFGNGYTDRINSVSADIKDFGRERSRIRHDRLVADAEARVSRAESRYMKKKAAAEAKLESAYGQLTSAQSDINAAEKKIGVQESRLNSSERKLNKSEKKLDQSAADVKKAENILKSGAPLPAGQKEQLEQSVAQYKEGRQAIRAGRQKIKKGRAAIAAAKTKIASSKMKLREGLSEYQQSKTAAERSFRRAEAKIDNAKNKISDIKAGKWYISDRSDNIGISNYRSDIKKVTAIATVFPIFFFLVAALVALTTMTRMIEEERLQAGILKSLGYSNGDILKYYLGYSLLASISGCAVGEAIGFAVFPKVISNAYSMEYNLSDANIHVIWPLALLISGVTIACILLTTFAACRRELAEKPAALMLPRAPESGKRILLERIGPLWSRLKFSIKVTLRNIFRYKKRFLMTIIGIAGCYALLVTGFGVRDSIGDVVNLQYNDLNKYDISCQMVNADAADSGTELSSLLNEKSRISSWARVSEADAGVIRGNKKLSATIVTADDPAEFTGQITLRDRKSHEKVSFDGSSLVLTEKMASKLNVSAGDRVEIDLKNGEKKSLQVTGVTENYIQNKVYIGYDAYRNNFHRKADFTTLLISDARGVSSDTITKELLANDDVEYVISSDTVRKNFNDSVGSIDYIIIVLIISAGALAMVVLYNLTNVNICERKRELAAIKVLGFYDHEVTAYIFREIYLLSVIGILLGIPLGIWLHSFVINTAEVDAVMFGRQIYTQSFFFAAGITLFFTWLVNMLMKKNINGIDMVESMKAND